MRVLPRAFPLFLALTLGGALSCDEEEDSGDESGSVDRGEPCVDEEDNTETPPGESKVCDCPGGDDAEKICLSTGEFTECFCEGGW